MNIHNTQQHVAGGRASTYWLAMHGTDRKAAEQLLGILQCLYHKVLGIMDYVEVLQAGSQERTIAVSQEGDTERYRAFLSELLVCIPQGAKKLCSPISFLQVSTQREVVARVIQRICEKKKSNVLAFGYGLVDEKSSLRVMFASNVCNYLPNPTTTTVSTSILWQTLLSRVGDDVMMHLLEHCSLYMIVPPNCCYQISGQPVYNLSNKETLPPAWLKQSSLMNKRNVLCQFVQKGHSHKICSMKINRWRKTKCRGLKVKVQTAVMAEMETENPKSPLLNHLNTVLEITTKSKNKKRPPDIDMCDPPAKKSKIVLQEPQSSFASDRQIDNPTTTHTCLKMQDVSSTTESGSKKQNIFDSLSSKTLFVKPCASVKHCADHTQIGRPSVKKNTADKYIVSDFVVPQNDATSYSSVSSTPDKQLPSKTFIDFGKILYTGQIYREAFLKNFLLNSLEINSHGSLSLIKTIFMSNNLFDQSVETQCPFESRGNKKLPKRYLQMRHVFQELLQNHKKCPYSELVKKHCPVKHNGRNGNIKEKFNKDKYQVLELQKESHDSNILTLSGACDNSDTIIRNSPISNTVIHSLPNVVNRTCEENIGHEKQNTKLRDEVNVLALLKHHNSAWQVYMFVRECLHRLVPEMLWGSSHNKCRFLKNVKMMIHSAKFEKISLGELMWKMRVEDCSWLRLKKRNFSVPASEHLLRERILSKFLYWLLYSYVTQLLRAFFYVTETMFQKNRLFFYRKCIWRKLQNFGIQKHLTNVKLRLMSNDEVDRFQQQKNAPLVSALRFIPKTNGLRPIAKICFTLGVQQRKEIRQRKMWHFNAQVRNLFAVLNYERFKTSDIIGSSVFGLDDIYRKWKKFVMEFQESNATSVPFYFVKTDVKRAFDTIPHAKLKEVISKVINPDIEEVYCIRRYAMLWTDSNGWIRKSFKRHVSSLVDFMPNMKSFLTNHQDHNMMQNTIFVEQSLSLNESSRKLLNFSHQIICDHILRIKDKYFMQCCGIPQGSVLSALLCSLCYGDLENKVFDGIQKDGTLAEGIPEYGCRISPDKTVVNFPIDDIPECFGAEQLPAHCLFPWCGLLLDTQTLEVFADYSSYSCTSIRSSLTFCHSAAAGKNLRDKLLRVLRLKCHSLFLDLEINSLRTVYINVYKIFLLQAYRFHACVLQLPFNQSVRKNPSFFLTVISDMAPCFYTILKAKNKDMILGTKDGSGPFPFEAAQWLSCHAFIAKLSNHKALYKTLLGPLHHCKIQLSRSLPEDTITLLKAVADASLHKDFSTIMD
ncbi:telomerase reverse transcriptase isoform X2 [Pseudophryne corroboree]|uniref:telomerase reverse transcriptase isoform X2 n=1 Tax=Pseudophryne corroboree TaxID=495146 RepID=UPI0030812B47